MARALRVAAALSFLVAGALVAQDPESDRKRTDISWVGAEYNYVHFQDDLDPWHQAAFSLGHRGARGTYIGRANYARRFGEEGLQIEADAYPRFNERFYGFANLGYSSADIFPDWRGGAELFAALPSAWEASAGYRELRFPGSRVQMLTGSVGKYIGNSWISARPFIRVDEGQSAKSVMVMGRRYFADADNYVGGRVSVGSSPSERGDPTEIGRNGAWSAALLGSRTLRPRVIGNWSIGFEREELSATVTRRRVDLLAGLRFLL